MANYDSEHQEDFQFISGAWMCKLAGEGFMTLKAWAALMEYYKFMEESSGWEPSQSTSDTSLTN